MSKYTFKTKEKNNAPIENDVKIMNANASASENTAVFTKIKDNPEVNKNTDAFSSNDIFIPEEYEPTPNKSKTKQHKSSGDFSVGEVFSHNTVEIEEDDSTDITATVEQMLEKDDLSVDEIKENLVSGKPIEISEVFNDRKKKKIQDEPLDTDDDVYDELEETPIELSDDEDGADEESDAEDVDIYSDDIPDDDIPKFEKAKKTKKAKELREYINPEEKEEFAEIYRKKGQNILLSLIVLFVSTLCLIYIETKTLPHPSWLMPGKYGMLYLMLDLQFVFISAICILNSLINGAKGLFTWQPNRDSVSFVSFTVAVIAILLHVFLDKYSASITLYSSVFSFVALVTALISFTECRREHVSFRTASSSKIKNCIRELDEKSAEYQNFSEYLPEDAMLKKITRTSFIKGFFKTNARVSPYNEMYKVSIPMALLAAIAFAIISTTLIKDTTITQGINNFALMFMTVLPVSSIFTVIFPFFITTLRLSRLQSTIIGEAGIEETASTALVSFEDTDVFNPKGIKITSIKTYGSSRIDNTYLIAAKLFNLLGGPLKEVFNRSVIATQKDESQDKILSVDINGINASIDGFNVYAGSKEYIELNGFTHIDDSIDSTFLSANGRILYVAINGEISAKFYIKYTLGKNFKALLDSFKNLGICMAVNTHDPNLDTDFVTQILKDSEYPLVVVNNTDIPKASKFIPSDSENSVLVSASGVSNVLRAILSAEKLSRIISINTLAKFISLIFAVALIIVAFASGASHEKISALFIIGYQIIWSLPVLGTSLFG